MINDSAQKTHSVAVKISSCQVTTNLLGLEPGLYIMPSVLNPGDSHLQLVDNSLVTVRRVPPIARLKFQDSLRALLS